MENRNQLIMERLKGLRKALNISVDDMAKSTEVSVEEYRKAEQDGFDYSFNFLYKCSQKFGIEVAELISGEDKKLASFQYTKKDDGFVLDSKGSFSYEHLAYLLKKSDLNPFRVTLKWSEEEEKAEPVMATHSGEEFDYVLKGTLKVIIGEHVQILNEGDSITYSSIIPHGLVAIGGDCEFLAIVTRGTGESNETKLEKAILDRTGIKQDEETIYNNFAKCTEDEYGRLQKIEFIEKDNFNFAYDVVDELAKKCPKKRAMLWLSKHKEQIDFTFEDISKLSTQCANFFAENGIKKGDKVMLILKRHYQFWIAIMALCKLGAVVIPATHLLTEKDLSYRFEAGDVKAVVCTSDGGLAEQVELAEQKVGKITKFIVNGSREGFLNFDEGVKKASDKMERVATQKDEPMLMFFTSGTTGYPRLAMHNYTYALGHLVTAKYWHKVDKEGIHFTISDTGWGKALWGKLYGQWLCEACIFTYDFDKFDAKDILPLFAKYNITTFCAPPTMYRFFIKENLADYDLSSIKNATIAGEALNPEVSNQFFETTGLRLMEGFGQTETTLTVGTLFGSVPKLSSMGMPNPQYDVDIVRPDESSVNVGEIGEIVIKSKTCGVFDGYYKNDECNKFAWRDGIYHTGDTAWRDEDGYYFYVGRNDDIIKSSGYRIGPFEIESVLMELPYILECAVTGAPDAIRGQVIKATIVLIKDKKPSDALKKEIQDYFKSRTAPYKYPRIIEFVDTLPKTISGKVRRVELRD